MLYLINKNSCSSTSRRNRIIHHWTINIFLLHFLVKSSNLSDRNGLLTKIFIFTLRILTNQIFNEISFLVFAKEVTWLEIIGKESNQSVVNKTYFLEALMRNGWRHILLINKQSNIFWSQTFHPCVIKAPSKLVENALSSYLIISWASFLKKCGLENPAS
jgi:hypothetical protein